MPKHNKKACRLSSRPCDALNGARRADDSTHDAERRAAWNIGHADGDYIIRWSASLPPRETAVLLAMLRLQASEGAPFPVSTWFVALVTGLPRFMVADAIGSLCSRNLLELARVGEIAQVNWYRVPTPLPQPALLRRIIEGGEA